MAGIDRGVIPTLLLVDTSIWVDYFRARQIPFLLKGSTPRSELSRS